MQKIPGESVTVNIAARILGCDPSTVRKMLRRGYLSGHRVGMGDSPYGVRVDLASVEAYKAHHAIVALCDLPAPVRRRRQVSNPACDEALAWLRSQGVRV